MKKILKPKFFDRPTLIVAKELLGKYLVRKIGAKTIFLKITEVEVYDGFKDLASHASRGRTKRNAPMFESAGCFYVYFTYGMHWMLNIVTGPEDYPAAILIRGAGDISGPARLTKFLKIGGKFNGKEASRKNGLWFENRGKTVRKKEICRLPRVGVDYAGKIWSKKLYRFLLKNS